MQICISGVGDIRQTCRKCRVRLTAKKNQKMIEMDQGQRYPRLLGFVTVTKTITR